MQHAATGSGQLVHLERRLLEFLEDAARRLEPGAARGESLLAQSSPEADVTGRQLTDVEIEVVIPVPAERSERLVCRCGSCARTRGEGSCLESRGRSRRA